MTTTVYRGFLARCKSCFFPTSFWFALCCYIHTWWSCRNDETWVSTVFKMRVWLYGRLTKQKKLSVPGKKSRLNQRQKKGYAQGSKKERRRASKLAYIPSIPHPPSPSPGASAIFAVFWISRKRSASSLNSSALWNGECRPRGPIIDSLVKHLSRTIVQVENPEKRCPNSAKIADWVNLNLLALNCSKCEIWRRFGAIKDNFGEVACWRIEVIDMDSLLIWWKSSINQTALFFFLEGGNWRWWILALPSSSTAEARGDVTPAPGLGTLMAVLPTSTCWVTYEPCALPEKDVR